MKEEDELLKKCGTKNPFMVPEGYFDNFSKELMNKLPEKDFQCILTMFKNMQVCPKKANHNGIIQISKPVR